MMSQITDNLRTGANLLFAVAQPAASGFSRWTGIGQSETERARATEGPVTPAGPAFVIWAPLFAASLAQAFSSATELRRHDPSLQELGWLTAVTYALNTAWSLNAQISGLGWGSVALIAASAGSASAALIGAERQPHSDAAKGVATAMGPLAGWLSVAAFANLETTLNQTGHRLKPVPEAQRAMSLLAAATVVSAAISAAARGNLLFSAAAAWGLGGVAVKNYQTRRPVSLTAGFGLLALAGFTLLVRSRR